MLLSNAKDYTTNNVGGTLQRAIGIEEDLDQPDCLSGHDDSAEDSLNRVISLPDNCGEMKKEQPSPSK